MQPTDEDLLKRITVSPDILVGKPTIRGMRLSVEQVLRALSAGVSKDDLLRDYPELEELDILAVLAYAAHRVADERVYPIRDVGG